MASTLPISRITWGLLGAVIITLIISITSLVLVVLDRSQRIADIESRMIKEHNENDKRVEDFESRIMKERKQNDERFADLESQMTLSAKQQGEFEEQWKDQILSFDKKISAGLENLTAYVKTTRKVVAFSVGCKRFAPTALTRIPMDMILYNEEGYFSGENFFTAPVIGLYSFFYSTTTPTGKYVHMYLYTQKPGAAKEIAAFVIDYGASGHGGGSGSVLLKLVAGETVSLWALGNSQGAYTYGFTGDYGNFPSTFFWGKLEQSLE